MLNFNFNRKTPLLFLCKMLEFSVSKMLGLILPFKKLN